MEEHEIAIIKRYVDAKVAREIRRQAYLKLSWGFDGASEEAALVAAEQDVNNLLRPRPAVKNREHYKPLESPRMYPLELDERLHINLWSEDGDHKWTIAMWVEDKECSELRFLHDRPFDPRVNWHDFEAIVRQGQVLADRRYEAARTETRS